MKKTILLGLVLVSLLFLSSCENVDLSKVSDNDLDRITGRAIVCNEPYIRYGTSCCLDKDANNICDRDEGIEEELPEEEGCEDECSDDSCSGLDYTECLMKSDSCKDKRFRGKITGKCGVECTTDNYCNTDEVCENYKCVQLEEPTNQFTILIKDLKLIPQELTVKKGDTVTWKHQDKGDGDDTRHYLAAHSNEFRTPILCYGDTFSHTFNTVGTFTYVDIVYKEKDDLRGEIIVEVECTVNNDCDSNEECNNYKCVKKEAECEDECVEGEVACENEVTRWYCYLQSNGCYDKIYEECREGETCKDGRCCTKSIMECGLDNECLPESMRALWCVGDDVYGEDWQVFCINPNTPESYCERCVINKKVGHCKGCLDGVCPVQN